MPSQVFDKPLFTAEQYAELKRQQRKLYDLLAEFDKAEQCGIDCAEMRGIAAFMTDQFANIEKHYMTPPPKQ